MENKWGNNGNSDRLFSWAPKSLQMVAAAMKLKKTLAPCKKSYDKPRQHTKMSTAALYKIYVFHNYTSINLFKE